MSGGERRRGRKRRAVAAVADGVCGASATVCSRRVRRSRVRLEETATPDVEGDAMEGAAEGADAVERDG